jgi:hypothetical protein
MAEGNWKKNNYGLRIVLRKPDNNSTENPLTGFP